MDVRLFQEQVLYHRRIYHYRNKYNTDTGAAIDLAAVVELTNLIPSVLITGVRLKLCPFVSIENNFNDIIHYLDWLDSLTKTISKNEYFTEVQKSALTVHRELSLESFLINSQGMIYYPYVILDNIRSKVMKLILEINNTKDDLELHDYYKRHITGFTSMISQPVFAIGELAALKHE